MPKSIKLQKDTYIDSRSVSYNRDVLQNILDNLVLNKVNAKTTTCAIANIDTTKIGVYVTNGDPDAPTSTNWYYVINIPSPSDQWIQISMCFWFLNSGWCDSVGKIFFRTNTNTNWSYISLTVI